MKIFVFGSNRQGRHGAGAALFAKQYRGAIYGQAEGRQGNSYAIITKELREEGLPVTSREVEEGVLKFIRYALRHPELTFEVTPIGCGLAGFTPEEIAPMFWDAPKNVELPEVFKKVLEEQ